MIQFISRTIGRPVIAYHRFGLRGAARLFAIIARIVNAEPLLVVKSKHNIDFALTPRHYIDTEIIRHKYYELEVLDEVLKHLNQGDVFWDVGANIGLHCITVKSLRPDTKVVAFEPNPTMLVRLLRSMSLNDISIQVVQAALWDSTTLQGLHLAPQSCNPGMTTLLPDSVNSSPANVISFVSCHAGDELVRQGLVPSPNVIKLDVEGTEGNVLDGLGETLESKSLQAVVFEHTPTEGTSDVNTPYMRLQSLGFRIEKLASHHWAEHSNYVAMRDC